MRGLANNTSPSKKWIILDGPVDSLWIESMNTVMDENKMLFLTNGERIAIPPNMRLIFEVPDLNSATPGIHF
jgi:dynein heavy chain